MCMEWLAKRKIVAIVRGLQKDRIEQLADALYQGGIDWIEVTFDQAHPDTWVDTAAAIAALAKHFAGGVMPGAGTVLTDAQMRLARDAGARYIVTPNTNPALIAAAKASGLCVLAGAFTPSEIVAAHDAGADAVKVFPASALGASYIKAVRAPLAHIPLLAVGGINEHNAADFLAAGCMGLGIGGSLVNQALLASGQAHTITEMARAYRKAVDAI